MMDGVHQFPVKVLRRGARRACVHVRSTVILGCVREVPSAASNERITRCRRAQGPRIDQLAQLQGPTPPGTEWRLRVGRIRVLQRRAEGVDGEGEEDECRGDEEREADIDGVDERLPDAVSDAQADIGPGEFGVEAIALAGER